MASFRCRFLPLPFVGIMKKLIEQFKRSPATFVVCLAIVANVLSVVLSLMALHFGQALWNLGLIIFLVFLLLYMHRAKVK